MDLRQEGELTVAVDKSVAAGHTYWYRLVGTANGTERVLGTLQGTAASPKSFELSAVWPNPAVGSVNAQFTVAKSAPVDLCVLDVQGRVMQVLARGNYEPGRYQVQWDGRTDRGDRAPGGIYFLRFESENKGAVKRLAILR